MPQLRHRHLDEPGDDARRIGPGVALVDDFRAVARPLRAKHNDMGQYPQGRVPRGRLYAAAFRQAREGQGRR